MIYNINNNKLDARATAVYIDIQCACLFNTTNIIIINKIYIEIEKNIYI